MGLKAPSILVFLLSVVIAVCALVAFLFKAQIPLITGREFLTLFFAYLLLLLGTVMRGL
ncbi:MAG: hypothetical protein KDJ41_01965 [Hyphomicrobiaceae bacterium]|nr:hypothetical protein [Hyphomicrobiaceae bacterium]